MLNDVTMEFVILFMDELLNERYFVSSVHRNAHRPQFASK